MEKIFCTGASGFVASNLIPELIHAGYAVSALDRYSTTRSTYRSEIVDGNLNDHDRIREIVANLQPDYVIHLASISPVAYSYEHPFEVTDTNFVATVNLAEMNRKYNPNLKQFLFAGTSEEYGIQEEFPIYENAELRPNSPYAVAKAAADHYLKYMKDAYNFPITVLRPFNTYGRNSSANMVVERILTQMVNGSHEVRLGDPEAIRDLMYVSDHVNAYLSCLGNSRAIGETFNFCTGVGVSIRELAELSASLTGYEGEIVWNTIPSRPLDIKILKGDYSKAKRILGWKPLVSLENGLKKTIEMLEGIKIWHTQMAQK